MDKCCCLSSSSECPLREGAASGLMSPPQHKGHEKCTIEDQRASVQSGGVPSMIVGEGEGYGKWSRCAEQTGFRLFRPLPFCDSQETMLLDFRNKEKPRTAVLVSPQPHFNDLQIQLEI